MKEKAQAILRLEHVSKIYTMGEVKVPALKNISANTMVVSIRRNRKRSWITSSKYSRKEGIIVAEAAMKAD